MEKRSLTYFVSDVHLGLDVKDAAGREKRFVEFLKGIPAEKTEALYMLGDIWDFWYEYRDVVPKGYARVFEALLSLMDAGVKVYFLPGNHDIWCYRYFESLGMKVVRDRYLVTSIGGKTFCLSHGDGLGRGMTIYKIMYHIFHSRFFQTLLGAVPPRITFAVGHSWSKRSRLAKNTKYEFRGEAEPLYGWAEKLSRTTRVDVFIFGHYHCSYEGELPGGARMVILKDWMDGSPYLTFDSTAGYSGSFPKIEK